MHNVFHITAYLYSLSIWLIIFGIAGAWFGSAQAISTFKRKKINKYLLQTSDNQFNDKTKGGEQPSNDDIKRAEFLIDRALQPLNEFNGFNDIEPFQTSAVRYQLAFSGYALSIFYTQYKDHLRVGLKQQLEDAQIKLIEKQRQPKIWGYWQLENIWGNLNTEADPIIKDNIMYSGFVSLQMVLAHTVLNEKPYLLEGSFTLKKSEDQIFKHDLKTLIDALKNGFESSDFTLISCEPNWVYPLCNSITASAVKSCDPEFWERIKNNFSQKLEEEFIRNDGKIVACRSTYTGISLPMIGGAMPQALPCYYLNALFPEIALRQWLILRRQIFKKGELVRKEFWKVDTGNYFRSRASAYSATALAAAEMGDQEVKDACLSALEDECPVYMEGNNFYRKNVSIWSHAVELMARSSEKNGFQALIDLNKGM